MEVIILRGKIAKKMRRDLLKTGAVIITEQPTGTKGYCVSFALNDVSVAVSGRDKLDAFKGCLEAVENEC